MDTFNAQQFQPQFGGGKHPPGMFDFVISNTMGKDTKDKTGGYLQVEMTSPAGKINVNFNLFNQSTQAVEIANKQLSALCHVTGIFTLTFPRGPATPEFPNGSMENFARELRGGRGRMEVGFQSGQEPTADNPTGGYVEIKKLFDVRGNEPGKQGGAAQPQMQQPQQQPAPQAQPPQQSGWGNPQPPQQQQPAPQPNAPGGGWAQQPALQGGPTPPPWGQPNR